jgi:polyphosphate kinase 2 (PPK2 family)
LREDRFQVFATAAPNEEEKARHYLWRFWRTFPPVGSIAIYDRSWYGRVLVERVEGFATEEQWSRAYGEICEMEESLTREGAILCKFWLEISPEEQLRRFEARLSDPQKRWKLTGEDWRNRSKREEYLAAAEDMFSLTDTTAAPWTIIPAEDKKYARLAVLRHILRTVPGK